jgi:hypothetical protein
LWWSVGEEAGRWHGWEVIIISCIVECGEVVCVVAEVPEDGAVDDRVGCPTVKGAGVLMCLMEAVNG